MRRRETGLRHFISNSIRCLAALAAVASAGCGTYQLRGHVVEGPEPMVLVTRADDPRLEQRGIGGASLELTLSPRSLGRKPLGSTFSGDGGWFAAGIDELGAGLLEYELGVVCRRQGYRTAVGAVRMPGGDQRLLVVLTPGVDDYEEPIDLLEESEQYLELMK